MRGRRIGAAFIDLFIYWALYWLAFFLIAHQEEDKTSFDSVHINVDLGDTVYFLEGGDAGLFWLAAAIAAFAYFGLLPGLTGWTPGKLMTGLRVVRPDGTPAGVGRNLARASMWVADGFPYILPGLVGFILILSTPNHRRVADMVADTNVVAR